MWYKSQSKPKLEDQLCNPYNQNLPPESIIYCKWNSSFSSWRKTIRKKKNLKINYKPYGIMHTEPHHVLLLLYKKCSSSTQCPRRNTYRCVYYYQMVFSRFLHIACRMPAYFTNFVPIQQHHNTHTIFLSSAQDA